MPFSVSLAQQIGHHPRPFLSGNASGEISKQRQLASPTAGEKSSSPPDPQLVNGSLKWAEFQDCFEVRFK